MVTKKEYALNAIKQAIKDNVGIAYYLDKANEMYKGVNLVIIPITDLRAFSRQIEIEFDENLQMENGDRITAITPINYKPHNTTLMDIYVDLYNVRFEYIFK